MAGPVVPASVPASLAAEVKEDVADREWDPAALAVAGRADSGRPDHSAVPVAAVKAGSVGWDLEQPAPAAVGWSATVALQLANKGLRQAGTSPRASEDGLLLS